LQKEPQDRYASAEELAEDLERFERGEPITARRFSVWESTWKWCKRNPKVAGLLTGLVAITIAGLSLILWSWLHAVAANARTAKALENLQVQKTLADQAAGKAMAEETRARAAEQKTATANEQLEDELQRTATTSYAMTLGVAWERIQEGLLSEAEQLLDKCPPERIGWEYHYLRRMCRPQVRTLEGHTDTVLATSFNADGRYLATAGKDGTIRIWDVLKERFRDRCTPRPQRKRTPPRLRSRRRESGLRLRESPGESLGYQVRKGPLVGAHS
jgi:hypothetical protein